jgi:hypothetical protein
VQSTSASQNRDIPHLFQIRRHQVDQSLNPIKPQPLALCMEIPIQIMRLGIRNSLYGALECLLDRLFVALLVDEVDEPDFVVDSGLLGEVESQRGYLEGNTCK